MKILVAEDENITRAILGKALSQIGHEVTLAEDGLEAWQLLQTHAFEMVVTDWLMPHMDGLELCKRIRSELQWEHYIYIIMLTSRSDKSDRIEVFESGADDYIAKPLDIAELTAKLKTGKRVLDLEKRHNRMQEVLIESRDKLKVVLDGLREEIVSVDKNYKILSANKAYIQASRLSFQNVVGKPLIDDNGNLMGGRPAGSIPSILENVFKNSASDLKLDSFTGTEGEKQYREVHGIPINIGHDAPLQVVIVSKDITEDYKKNSKIKALNRALKKALGEIQSKNQTLEETLTRLKDSQVQILQSEKMASIGQLAAGVAHEINNPTGFVSSNLKTLEDYQTDIKKLMGRYMTLMEKVFNSSQDIPMLAPFCDEIASIRSLESEIDIEYILDDTQELIEDCRDGTDRIKKIVADLKDFAHPGEDKKRLANVNEGLESTLNVVYNELKYKATITKHYGEVPDIACYSRELNQVFMNILVNAGQAIENSGKIEIETRYEDGMVKIIISDTGCGIPEEHLNKIFDPFFTTKDVGKGTGLGMNIAYKIIQKHEGRIEVESEVGRGTTFIISLPVENVEECVNP